MTMVHVQPVQVQVLRRNNNNDDDDDNENNNNDDDDDNDEDDDNGNDDDDDDDKMDDSADNGDSNRNDDNNVKEREREQCEKERKEEQKIVDEDTVIDSSGTNDDGDHVNKGNQRKGIERERDTDNNNDDKIRNKMESRTHGIILVMTNKDGWLLLWPNKEKYNFKDAVLGKEQRWILQAQEDERFVKGYFCFRFIESTKPSPRVTVNKITKIQKVQQKLHSELQKEFKRKLRKTKKYLDDMGEVDSRKEARKLEKREKSNRKK